jgi:hypothetical protein
MLVGSRRLALKRPSFLRNAGSIPTELGTLINMDTLALAYNQLTGTLRLFMFLSL